MGRGERLAEKTWYLKECTGKPGNGGLTLLDHARRMGGGSLGSLSRIMTLRDAPTRDRYRGRRSNSDRDSAHAILNRSDARAFWSAVDSPKREEGRKEVYASGMVPDMYMRHGVM